ncbi:MAG: T9SS type A sorting domain-containing protein [Phycisphaerae bacterium]|nr:T9SS type A sorting domain-containing protein [Saprospiraceae bacterium]
MKLIFKIFALIFCCFYFQTAQAQESTFGNITNQEEATDGKPIPANKSIVLANTLSFGTSKICLTRLNALGAVEMFATIQQGSFQYFGKSIDLDYTGTTHTGYFITGARQLTGGLRQLILIRTDLNGTPIWTKMLPNVDGVAVDECGVSVERQSNGDVVVVGSSNKSGFFKIVMARFSMANNGTLLWCYRYGSDLGLSFEPAEACNGMRPSPNPGAPPVAVIAVTGKYTKAGPSYYHTFLFLVNAQSGTEIWRQTYNSIDAQDEGLDVVYKPAANEFDPAQYMVVGQKGIDGHPNVWVVRANASSGAGTGAIYNAAGLWYGGFVARGVSLSLHSSGTRAVVCGSILGFSKPSDPSLFINRTFAMELPFAAGSAATWAHYYNASDPIYNVSESISRIPASSATPAGYFITGASLFGGSAYYNQHAIRTNSTGKLGLADCPEVPFLTAVASGMTTTLKGNNKVAVTSWNTDSPNRTTRIFIQQRCDGVPFGGGDAEGRSDENEVPVFASSEAKLFPNPVIGNQPAQLSIEMAQTEIAQVEVFDITGKQIWAFEGVLDNGYQEMELPTNQWTSGVYLVRLQSTVLNKTLKLIVNR